VDLSNMVAGVDLSMKEGLKRDRLAWEQTEEQKNDRLAKEEAEHKKRKRAINPDGAKDKDGKPCETYFDTVRADYKKALDSTMSNVNSEWWIGMMEIVHMALNLSKAMTYDSIEWTNLIPGRDKISAHWKVAKEAMYGATFKDQDERKRMDEMDDSELPKVSYNVHIDSEGKLDVNATKGCGPVGAPAPEVANKIKEGIGLWAQNQGFLYDPNGDGKLYDANNKPMTQQEFADFNENNVEDGVVRFLDFRYQLKLQAELNAAAPVQDDEVIPEPIPVGRAGAGGR